MFNEVNVERPTGKGVKIALLYPGPYTASLTNLFTHISYYLLSSQLPSAVIDRFTSDNPSKGALTGLPLTSFDVVLASVGFELDLLQLAKILLQNSITPLTHKRSGKNYPVLIGGGPALMANPFPATSILDYIYVGEGEELLAQLIDSFHELPPSTPRWRIKELLHNSLLQNPSVVCRDKPQGMRYHPPKLDDLFIPDKLIRSLTHTPIYGDGYYIEVSRGCRWLCPYCMESHVFHPPRHRSKDVVVNSTYRGVENLRVDRVVFYSLSFFDHPEADDILYAMLEKGILYSVPSLRYHTLNEERVKLIRRGGQRTLTLAPETGSRNASCLIRKDLDSELIEALSSTAFEEGMNVKLYFMFGLPGEGDDAGKAAGELVKRVAERNRKVAEGVKVSVNPLIPKSWTPLQYCPLIRKEEFKRKSADLRKMIKGLRIRVFTYDWRWAHVQAIISLGDEAVGEVIAKWGVEGGGPSNFIRILRSKGLDPDFPLEPRNPEDFTKWRNIDDIHKEVVQKTGEKIYAEYCSR